jgi:acyl-coenzyme A synthetase/AMP-(fatty) acid ligase
MKNFWDIKKYGKKTALNNGGERLDYAGLAAFSADFGGRLLKGGLIFNLCDNNIESVVGYVSFLRLRRAQALVNPALDKRLLASLINAYEPSYIWLDRSLAGELAIAFNVRYAFGRYILAETAYGGEYRVNPELAVLLTTSGSTGSPKLVRQSYENISANARDIAAYLELDDSSKPITTLPMSYTFGLSIINSHLLVGTEIVLTDKKIIDGDFWELFRETEPTTFGGVPFTFQMLDALDFIGMELPSLRVITQAGGKLGVELHTAFARYSLERGIRFYAMYGQTEATARIAYLPHEYALEKPDSIGISIPDGKIWLEGEGGEIVSGAFTAGELVYAGKNVTLGYAESRLDLDKGDENGGVLRTGDIAQRDGDGFYYIVGRKKRFIKIFGSRVNLDELEKLIKTTAGCEAAATGQDDGLRVYVTDENAAGRVKAYLSDVLKLSVTGFSVKYIKELPRSESGKLLYSKLED